MQSPPQWARMTFHCPLEQQSDSVLMSCQLLTLYFPSLHLLLTLTNVNSLTSAFPITHGSSLHIFSAFSELSSILRNLNHMASKSDLVTQGSHHVEFLASVFQVHIIITNEIFGFWFWSTVVSTYFLILCLFSQKQTNKQKCLWVSAMWYWGQFWQTRARNAF